MARDLEGGRICSCSETCAASSGVRSHENNRTMTLAAAGDQRHGELIA